MENEPYESTESIDAWAARRRPGHDAARLLGMEPADDRDEQVDVAMRDLVMEPVTAFDRTVHPALQFDRTGWEWFRPGPPDLFDIYGPAGAAAEPDRDLHYLRDWSFVDPFGWVNIYANADRLTGRFAAAHSLTSGYGQAFAAVGVVMVPDVAWCELSIRPYVAYTGSFYLSGRRPEDAWENATSTAWASVGILVESWAVEGGSYRLDWDQPVVVSSYSQTNPTKNYRGFNGSASVSDGLTAKVFASGARRYRIWVYCWAEVQAQMLASAGAYAAASIDCYMPYLVVEQIKI